MLATYRLRSHTQGPPLIFHRKEERGAYIILTEPEWRETSPCYLHTHMHCQRFIVQGFNGALTPLSLSLYSLSSQTHKHTSIHHSASSSCFPPPLCLSSISAVHLPSPFTFHFSPPLYIFSSLYKTAPNVSPVARLIESAVKNKDVKVWFSSKGESKFSSS